MLLFDSLLLMAATRSDNARVAFSVSTAVHIAERLAERSLIRENRITFATFPETYYNRKMCTGHVKMNLSYIPFDSDYCLS